MSDLTSPRNALRDSHLVACIKKSQMINCKHDPVQRLPPETITNIICYLDAEDTEKLRRLSKSWKSASETSNSKQAVLRHFPRSSCPPLTTGLQYNLFFRRLLYHNSSLKRGRVTKSHYFSNVYRWGLRSNRLVLMSRDQKLRIYDLASRSDDLLKAEHCMLKTQQQYFTNRDIFVSSVSLTSHGEIVVRSHLRQLGVITSKISTDLTQQWSVTVHWDVVAVGIEHIYGLEFTGRRGNVTARLVTRRFDNEAEISDLLIPGSFPRAVTRLTPPEATMTSNEQFLILSDEIGILSVIDVLVGTLVPVTGVKTFKHVTNTSIFLHPESPDFRVSGFEQMTRRFMIHEYVYDAKLAVYNISLISTVDFGKEKHAASVGLDSDLANHLLVMRRGQIYVEKDEGTWEILIKTSSTSKGCLIMTTPSDEGRADLLVPRLGGPEEWDILGRTRSYFGIVDGYLVYHDAMNHRLMVADFWPSW